MPYAHGIPRYNELGYSQDIANVIWEIGLDTVKDSPQLIHSKAI